MRAPLYIFVLLTLSACSNDWPTIERSAPVTEGAWPELLPLNEITGASVGSGAGQTRSDEGQRLAARAANLQARARLMRQRLNDDAAIEALRARLNR